MSDLLQAVSRWPDGSGCATQLAEIRIAVVGAAIWKAPTSGVVVESEDLAAAQDELA